MKSSDKLTVFNLLLEKSSVFVHLDGTQCIFLPEHLKLQEQVVLQFGLDMAIPIRDLLADEQGVSGTLSFKGKKEYVKVLWATVFALVGEDGKGVVYSEDMPDSVKNKMNTETPKSVAQKPQPKTHDYRTPNKPNTQKRPNHLRLVK